ncbi:cardiolipin synthase [uncultured Muriicola sp.]|uniref:cardiolipin synthase n=1 Tax=uncultured Muriicola sp. TaxID=1583102 RepID=UPI00260B1D55|nr:cardiolipin synthase [uncultured Muriicola sp.]
MLVLALVILYILLALFLIAGLLINGVRPARTLAWLLAIFTIPVGGILLYIMLGRNRRKKKLARLRKNSIELPSSKENIEIETTQPKYKKMMSLVKKVTHYPPTSHNGVTLLEDGANTFNRIFEALEKAESYIYLQYYIFEEGKLANKLLTLFEEKIREGVLIKMIYDGVGSYSLSGSYLKKLKAMGVEVYPFLPFRFGRFLSSLNYRNHRKIIVVDGIIAFTGGINISDKYLRGDSDLGKWHDMHLAIQGPAVSFMEHIFISDWFMVAEKKVPMKTAPKGITDTGFQTIVQVVPSGPDDAFPNIEHSYLSIINEAQEYLYITNPYIIPSNEILKALQIAALSGIDVRLLIAEKSDSKLVDWTVRSYFDSFLKSGIRIFLFPYGFLHSKILVSDDDIASIGTANIDVRSFEHNYEVNALVYDRDTAKILRKNFLRDCKKSTELRLDSYSQRPTIDKLIEGTARVFTPVL